MLHLLDLDGMKADSILDFLDHAQSFIPAARNPGEKRQDLAGLTVINLFFEGSTRTRTAFELAAKKLSADVVSFDVISSSTSKGETLRDTLLTLRASAADIFVIRHGFSGAARFVAERVVPQAGVINAGDGSHAHPTQALLDLLAIRQSKKEFSDLRVVIIGDLLHSRVARSLIHGLQALSVPQICACAPLTLLPEGLADRGIEVHCQLDEAIKDADVVISLRLQKERMQHNLLPGAREYFRYWGLTEERMALARPDALVMHPGPINRGQDISSSVADSDQSAILRQVTNGMAVRMAVLARVGQAIRAAHS